MALHSAVRGLLAGRRRLVESRLRREEGQGGADEGGHRHEERATFELTSDHPHRPLTQLPRVPRGPNIHDSISSQNGVSGPRGDSVPGRDIRAAPIHSPALPVTLASRPGNAFGG
jgi:hypothetical protein